MDLQTVINIGAGGALAVAGWFTRVMWEATKELRDDLSSLREQIPQKYVAKDDYRADLREIKELLQGLHDKLDRKADK